MSRGDEGADRDMRSIESPAPPDASQWEDWDLRRSLFDNRIGHSFESNLQYMYKKFNFHFPDAAFLKDPEGLLR
jgi:hypothetical protein